MLGFASLASYALSEVPAASRIFAVAAQLLASSALSGLPALNAGPTASLTGQASVLVAFGQVRIAEAEIAGSALMTAAPRARIQNAATIIGSATMTGRLTGTFVTEASLTGSSLILVDTNFRIYAATREFITKPTDTPANVPFYGTIQKALRLDRSIISGSGFGAVTSGWGEMELINLEGDYDNLISEYAVDGRAVTVKVGEEGSAYDSFVTLYEGTAAGWHVEEDVLRLNIRDNAYLIEKPAAATIYAGTGGVEGLDDLKGKRKPRAFGDLRNVAPPLIGMVPVFQLYQVNDGPVDAITAVYDRGVLLTPTIDYATSTALLAATTGAAGSGAAIEAGEYGTCLAEGFFMLGGAAAGQITCDLRGDKLGGVYVEDTVGIVRRLLATVRDVTPVPNETSFVRVAEIQPAPVGYWLGVDDEASTADVIADLMTGIGGWGGFRRNGTFEIGLIRAPGQPMATYDRVDIIEIAREQLPEAYDPPPSRYRVAWGRNWTVQTDLDGQNGVTAERVAFVAEPYRIAATAESAANVIRANHPRAQDPAPVESYFRDQADAQAEADRKLALFAATRSLYRIVIKAHPFVHEIGETIRVFYPRWDLKMGRDLVIVALTEDTDANQVEMRAWG